jgi:hypothetical protein
MCPDLVVENEGPLDPNKVVVQITDLLVVEDRTYDSMFTLRVGNFKHAFYSGAILYDHDQIAIYNRALMDWNLMKRADVR